MTFFRGQFFPLTLLPRVLIYLQTCCSPYSLIVKHYQVSHVSQTRCFCFIPLFQFLFSVNLSSYVCLYLGLSPHSKTFVLAHRQVSTVCSLAASSLPVSSSLHFFLRALSTEEEEAQGPLSSGFHFRQESPTHCLLSSAA